MKYDEKRRLACYFCPILMKFELSQQIVKKSFHIKFHENPYSRRQVVPCTPTGIQMDTDMMKLTVAFLQLSQMPLKMCTTT